MKIIYLISVLFIIGNIGCTNKDISKDDFKKIWKEYLKKEFEESFDEKQSIDQRENLLKQVLKQFNYDYEEFIIYMEKEQKDKHSKIFLK